MNQTDKKLQYAIPYINHSFVIQYLKESNTLTFRKDFLNLYHSHSAMKVNHSCLFICPHFESKTEGIYIISWAIYR